MKTTESKTRNKTLPYLQQIIQDFSKRIHFRKRQDILAFQEPLKEIFKNT